TIEVSEEDPVLVFSSVGDLTEEVSVQNRSVIDLVLYPDIVSLSEVVVTALGIERETKRLGYSATAVDPDELTTNRTTNVMESLEGKVAGLNISPPAAGVGSSMQTRLRGQSSFAGASNSPLFVINGLPMDQ